MFSPWSHPSRQLLHDYAESLVHRETPVQAAVAGHVNRCARCRAEVADIRDSLDFTHSAGQLEPTQDLTAQILLAAQQERRVHPAPTRLRAAGTAVAVSAVLALGFTCLVGVLGTGPQHAHTKTREMVTGSEAVWLPRVPEELAIAVKEGAAAQTPGREVLEAALARARAARQAAEAAQRSNPRNREAAAALRHAQTREPALLRQLYLGQMPGAARE